MGKLRSETENTTGRKDRQPPGNEGLLYDDLSAFTKQPETSITICWFI